MNMQQNKKSDGVATLPPEESCETEAAIALSGIVHPGQNDVKFGRGGDTNYHIGNTRFRHFVAPYKKRYQTASKEGRQAVVQEIVDDWRAQRPPGRFLTRTDPENRESSTWHDVGDEKAIKKAVKVLGEGLGVKRRKKSNADTSQQKRRRSGLGDVVERNSVTCLDESAAFKTSFVDVVGSLRDTGASPDNSWSDRSGSPTWDALESFLGTPPVDDARGAALPASHFGCGQITTGTAAPARQTPNPLSSGKSFLPPWWTRETLQRGPSSAVSYCAADELSVLSHSRNAGLTVKPRFAVAHSGNISHILPPLDPHEVLPPPPQPRKRQAKHTATLQNELPVAASLTTVFNNGIAGASSSDSAE